MNSLELAFYLVTLVSLFFYFRYLKFSNLWSFIFVGTCAFPAFLSLSESTQFLTTDARIVIDEAIFLRTTNTLTQWHQNLSRTTDLVFLPLAEVIHFLFPSSSAVFIKMIWKGLHWFQGFFLIVLIHYFLIRLFKLQRSIFFSASFFPLALLLPSNNLALKEFNYDLLSMLLACLAIVTGVLSHKENSKKYSYFTVFCATLAAQEKLTASPFLILSIISHGLLVANVEKESFQMRKCLRGTLSALCFSMCLALLGTLVLFVLRNGNIPNQFWLMSFDPIVSWIWVISKFTLNDMSLGFRGNPTLLGIFVAISSLFAGSVGICLSLQALNHIPKERLKRIQNRLSSGKIIFVFCVFAFSVGLFGILYVQAYWHPFRPILPNEYFPVGEFNSTKWHFGARGVLEHIWRFIAFSYSVLVASVPTMIWIVLAGSLFRSKVKREYNFSTLFSNGLITFSLFIPFLFGLIQIPVLQKYINISLFLLGTGVLLKVSFQIFHLRSKTQYLLSVFILSLVLLEVNPYGPLYASFRPFWVNYPNPDVPVAGEINPSWVGWGEEVMIVGKMLQKKYGQSSKIINLYAAYTGEWLNQDPKFHTIQFFNVDPLPLRSEFSYTDRDFYIINRSIVVQEAVKFPKNVKPEFTIEFRGFTQAWIYRGDHLKLAGFQF